MKTMILSLLLGFAPAALAHGNPPSGRDYTTAEATPFGIAADPKTASRTVRVEMSDAMRFTPSAIAVRRGEVVRFVAANRGQVLHEMVLGTKRELRRHAALMKKFPGMEHDEPYLAHVAPGKTGEIGWRFTQAGTFHFGCLIPGHYEAGMLGTITVR
jgi:uncharacterized cupredoxin-like copper-binding protein